MSYEPVDTRNLEVDGTIRLGDEELRHPPKADCDCDRKTHPVTATIDLDAVLQAAADDGVTAEVLPEAWEKAVQRLHDQAGHRTAYAENCREDGCIALYGGEW